MLYKDASEGFYRPGRPAHRRQVTGDAPLGAHFTLGTIHPIVSIQRIAIDAAQASDRLVIIIIEHQTRPVTGLPYYLGIHAVELLFITFSDNDTKSNWGINIGSSIFGFYQEAAETNIPDTAILGGPFTGEDGHCHI